jgi:hypothetical protein
MSKEIKFKKWAVIWKRDKVILDLYSMKHTEICTDEWEATTGENHVFNSEMIFESKSQAEKWRGKNSDWEVVLVEIKIISQ